MDILKLYKLAYKRLFRIAAVEFQPALEEAKQNVPPQVGQFLDQIGQVYYEVATAELEGQEDIERFYLKALQLRDLIGNATNTFKDTYLQDPALQQFLGTITQGLQEEMEFVDEEYKKPDLIQLQQKYNLSDEQVEDYIETFVEQSEPEQVQQEFETVKTEEKMEQRLQGRKESERESKQKQRANMTPEQRKAEKDYVAGLMRKKRENLTDEEKAQLAAYQRKYQAQMSPEQKAKAREKTKEKNKKQKAKKKNKKLDELLKRRGLI